MADPNKFKNHIRPENKLPEDLSWDNVEEGIYGKMEIQRANNSNINKIKSFIVGILGISAIATILYISVYHNTANEETISSTKQFENTNQILNSNTEEFNAQDKHSNTQKSKNTGIQEDHNFKSNKKSNSNQKINPSNIKNIITNEIDLIENTTFDKKNIQEKDPSGIKRASKPSTLLKQESPVSESFTLENNTIVTKNVLQQKSAQTQNAGQPSTSSATLKSKNNLVQKTSGDTKSALNSISKIVNQFDPIDALEINKLSISTRVPQINQSEITLIKKQNSKWSIFAQQAIGVSTISFSGEAFSNEKNQYENGIVSTSTLVGAAYKLNKDWSIRSGIQYDQLNTKLDFYFSNDTIVNKDIVTQQYIHPLNGDTTQVVENIPVEGTSWRALTNYNNYKNYSIPLILSKSWNNQSKLRLNTDLGILIGINGTAKGKVINEDKTESSLYLVNDLQENIIYQYQSSVSVMLGLSATMPISNNLEFGVGITGQQSLTDLSNSLDEKMNLGFIGFNLNLAYRL